MKVLDKPITRISRRARDGMNISLRLLPSAAYRIRIGNEITTGLVRFWIPLILETARESNNGTTI